MKALVSLVTAVLIVAGAEGRAQEASGSQSRAESMPLDQLLQTEIRTVIGASRYQQLAAEAPASVTIVTADEIERFGYRTLADVLRGVRGFYLSYDRNYTYVGVRGFLRPGDYNSRILVLIDGHRMNDNVYDAILVGTEFPLDVEMIDRVEVVRGPASTVYGANAFFGVINVITRQPGAGPPALVSGEAGSLGTVRGRASGTGRFGTASVLGSVSAYRSHGQDRIEYPELGVTAVDMDQDEAWNAFASARLGDWRLTALSSSREKRIPTGAYGVRFDDPRSRTTDRRAVVGAAFERAVQGFEVLWRGGLDWSAYDGVYASGSDADLIREKSRGTWLNTSASASRRLGRHFLSGGFDWRGDLEGRQTSTVGGQPVVDVDMPQREYGFYIQDDVAITSRLHLHGGISHDVFNGFDNSTNVRGAAILKPAAATTVKVLYGSAFRAPNAYERFYYEYGGEAMLNPETVQTAEVAVERQVSSGLRLLASAFKSISHRLVTLRTDGTKPNGLTFYNGEDATTRGLEGELEYRPVSWLTGLGTYTYQQGRGDGELTNSPRHLVKARLRAHTGPLVAGVEALHVGSRLSLDGSTTPSGTMTNVTITGREIRGGVKLTMSVQNLLAAKLRDPARPEHRQASLVQDGRTLHLKATWAF